MKRLLLIPMVFGLVVSCDSGRPSGRRLAESVITGDIIGSGNKAPALCAVELSDPGNSDPPVPYPAGRNGSFTVTTSETGVVRLSFFGAMHQPHTVSLFLSKPSKVRMRILLSAYEWAGAFDDVVVIGDFNGFSRAQGGVRMVKQTDGSYLTEIGNLAAGLLACQLVGLVKNSTMAVPGTSYDEISADPRRDFVAHVRVRDGIARIELDPRKLPRGVVDAGAVFEDMNSEVATIAALDAGMRARQADYARAAAQHRAAGNTMRDFRFDWSAAVADLDLQLHREKNPVLRQMLWICLLDLARLRAPRVDEHAARQALVEVPPDSPLWAIPPRSLVYAAIKLAGVQAHQGYFAKVVNEHPSREVRAWTLEQAYTDVLDSQDLIRAREFYDRLTTEFGDLRPGQRARLRPPDPPSQANPLKKSGSIKGKLQN